MFVEFLYELRDKGVQVGAQEALSLAQALGLELHKGTLDGFYEVARALCVHREQDLDAFDRAFAHHFRGVPEEELDIEGTIDKTARNAGELELSLRPPRRSNLHVLLLLDVGVSMDPPTSASGSSPPRSGPRTSRSCARSTSTTASTAASTRLRRSRAAPICSSSCTTAIRRGASSWWAMR
jgi:uncharacterized protein with von Willebrand factor type A (vWA) domain